MVKVHVELLLTHDANSKLSVTRQDIGMTHLVPSFTATEVENFKGKSLFFIKKNLFNVDCIAYRGRNVRKITDVRVHFSLV